MPVFNQIELFLDGSYPREEQKSFIFKSRCICNYLEQALDKKGFETTLSRVNINCSKDESEVRLLPLKGAPFLEVCIKYDLPPFLELDEYLLQRHYMQIIDLGLTAAESFMPVPHSYCMTTLQRFESEGGINEWIQAQKSWKKWSVRCDVVAKLTMEKFTLLQCIYRDDDLIAKRQIAETKPREMLFIDYLGELSMDRSGNIVYKRKRKVLTKFRLETNEFIKVD